MKLADFGTSERAENNDTVFHTNVGTREYQAPEFFDYLQDSDFNTELGEYDSQVDIWSFACIMHEIMVLHVPFPLPNSPRAFCLGREQFPEGPFKVQPGIRTSAEGIEFIKSVMVPHPKDRPTAAIAIQHTWFRGMKRLVESSQSG